MSKFRAVLTQAQSEYLAPLILNALAGEDWGTFDVHLKAQERVRKPDGWFHPSEHPLMTERQLYYYLTSDQYEREPMDPAGSVSVTVGKIMHALIEHIATQAGVRLNEAEMAEVGFAYDQEGEPSFSDEATGARGHTDGILHAFPVFWSIYDGTPSPFVNFELKTTNPANLRGEVLDLQWFMGKWPGYYAQQQEYLRMSKLPGSLVLLMGTAWPWQMKEVWVPSDPFFQAGVAEKYLRVRQAVVEGRVPDPCCNAGSATSRACPARFVCPRGGR